MQKLADVTLMWALIVVIIFLIVTLAHGATATFSCDGDPVAAGYRLQSAPDPDAGPWTEIAVAATCSFVIQLPEETKFWRVCAFKETLETCATTRGFFTKPAPPSLNVGRVRLN